MVVFSNARQGFWKTKNKTISFPWVSVRDCYGMGATGDGRVKNKKHPV
jgi:hypothetical protein